MLVSTSSPARHDRAVIVCCDTRAFDLAQFVLWRVALADPDRRYDLCICTFDADPPQTHPAMPPIRVCSVDKARFLSLKTAVIIPAEAYLRVALPDLFETDYRQIVYLDTDTLPMDRPLSDLFAAAPAGRPLCATIDGTQWERAHDPRVEAYWQMVGVMDRPYLNSGVLVFDVAAWVSAGLMDKVLADAQANGQNYPVHDQSAINKVLRGDWHPLSLRWNWPMTPGPARLRRWFAPHLLHFVGDTKPYLDDPLLTSLPYRRVYTRFFRDVLGKDMPSWPIRAKRRIGRTRAHPILVPGEPRTWLDTVLAFNPMTFTPLYGGVALIDVGRQIAQLERAIANGRGLWPPEKRALPAQKPGS